LNSTPCVQYVLFGKVNVSHGPRWAREHAVKYLPVAGGCGRSQARGRLVVRGTGTSRHLGERERQIHVSQPVVSPEKKLVPAPYTTILISFPPPGGLIPFLYFSKLQPILGCLQQPIHMLYKAYMMIYETLHLTGGATANIRRPLTSPSGSFSPLYLLQG
jgi:hypothetical protein